MTMKDHLKSLLGLEKDLQKKEFKRLLDLIYTQGDVNGICADDEYIMEKSYFEADLDNLFYRKNSKFKSYEDWEKIECQKIPVYSFRYNEVFCKSEEKEFKSNMNSENMYAQLCSQISVYLKK